MKFFGDEYLKWEDIKGKLDDLTIKQLIYNKYTEMNPNESIYMMATPSDILIELIKRIKQMTLAMEYPGKYDKIIAKSLGYKPEEIEDMLKQKQEDYIR